MPVRRPGIDTAVALPSKGQSSPKAAPTIVTLSPNGQRGHGSPPWLGWLEVDLDAVEHNVRALSRLSGAACELFPVVKGQAYGLGAPAVAEAALRAGAAGLAVARVCEAVELRQRGIRAPILLLCAMAPEEMALVVEHELTASLADVASAKALNEAGAGARKVVAVHIKADTGLTRFGARAEELFGLVRHVAAAPFLAMEGLYTHFASADESDLGYARQQFLRFQQLRTRLEAEGYSFRVAHAANSAALMRLPEARLDAVRPGLALLGAYASSAVPRVADLLPVFKLMARVARVYSLPPGTSVGYGRIFQTQRPTLGALVPLGYGDGVARAISGRGSVLLHGRRAPVIGSVSMDQFVVDVTELRKAKVHDQVVLIGRQADEEITLEEFAQWSDTIPHEALTRLGSRLPRVYVRDGRYVSATTQVGEVVLAAEPSPGSLQPSAKR